MFTTSHDTAVARWNEPEGEYAVAVEEGPRCPAGEWLSGHNAARRRGDGTWWGDQSVVGQGHHAEVTHNNATFESWAPTADEAHDIATYFAHWAEGDVYVLGFTPNSGASRYVGDYFTADGLPPSLDQVKEALR